jgi:hypothetical protein
MDDAPVVKATGRSLDEWFEILDERGGRALSHKEIARMLRKDHGVPGWWCQSVTVEYEKHIGRRETGQRQSGRYTTTASRTLPGTIDEALDRWLAPLPKADEALAFDGVPFAGEPRISRTPKWRYWRVELAGGAKVTVSVSAKPGGEAALLAVETDTLTGRPDIERWKAYWKAYLAGI